MAAPSQNSDSNSKRPRRLPSTPCSALEAWLFGDKSRWVRITHDNGYGASVGWEVTLGEGKEESETFGFIEEESEWDSLEGTISRALLKQNAIAQTPATNEL